MSSSPTHLIAQSQILNHPKPWHSTVFQDLTKRLEGNSDFPCVFSKSAFRKQLLKFIFVEKNDATGIQNLSSGLKEYIELSQTWDGGLDTAYPLVVAFSKECINTNSVEEYHAFGWKVLRQLHEIDPTPWPEHIDRDPESADWSMCFNGMAIFCNMSSPAHRVRKSRNLGEHFMFVINPRERFDAVAGNTPTGRKMRINIRNRIKNYDGIPHSPQLGFYGSGSSEWWQYGLIETNSERNDVCPFTAHNRNE